MVYELSIIVPVYNVEKWLPACIDSIISQTFTDWELILIDDGSTDGSGGLCDYYASKDERITVIHKENAGVSAARNDGLDHAKGKYVTFIDSDDELGTVTTLEENLDILKENPEIDIVQFPWCEIKDNRPLEQWWRTKDKILSTQAELITSLSYFELTYQVWQKIYRTEALTGIRFRNDMKIGEDAWFLMDALPALRKVYLSATGMYRYNVRESSAMNTMDASKKFDEFRMSYRLFLMLCSINGVSENTKAYYFYTVIERMCIAQAAGNYTFRDELAEMKRHIPHLSQLFHRMKKRHKRYLIKTKIFGLDSLIGKKNIVY